MSEGAVTRKLTAILYADVAGYSRLTGEDEVGTHQQLAAGLDLISQSVKEGDGRVVHYAGDAVLAEFASVVAAVQTAVSIQRALEKHSVEKPEDKRLTFRIGVNFGEVIVDRDEIYGDGVNVAARLEERAPPGGICISDRVYSDIRGKIDVGIVDLGDQELKNIAEPVRVYRVLTGPDSGSGALRQAGSKKSVNRAAAVAAVIVVVIGTALWQQTSGPEPTLQATTKPSIAVLPFTNSNSDTKDDFFSEGITNDIIIDLSKFQNLLVIASNSVSAYKGKTVDVKMVSRELGVRYVLEGNVLRRGERVRINVQLTDGTTGQHLWAERYDQAADNIWDIQDEITGRIVRTLAVRITEIEEQRVLAKSTENLEAYEYTLRGQALLARQSRTENFEARNLFRRAIELDPNYATAYAGLGWTYFEAVRWGWTGSPQDALQQAHDLSQRALILDTNDISGRHLLASVYNTRRRHDLSLIESERLIAINPNDAVSHAQQGIALTWLGRPDGGIRALERALLFDPDMPADIFWHLGLAYYLKERYVDSAAVLERNIGRKTDPFWDYMVLAAVYAQMDRKEDAARAAQAVRQIDPQYKRLMRFGQFNNSADIERVSEGLRKAGL